MKAGGFALALALAALSGVARAEAPDPSPQAAPPPGEAWVRDLRPTKLERGDTLTVELEGGAPRGPAIILLRPAAVSAGARAPMALRGRALGDGRVVAPIDAGVEARVGHDVRWSHVAVEVTLVDTGEGDVWAATGGRRVWTSRPGDDYDLAFFPGSLRGLADQLAARHRVVIAGHRVPPGFVRAAVLLGVPLLLLLLVAPLTGLLVVWERKIAGRMQSRFGPNRVGPSGWLQWLADALKLIRKEDSHPRGRRPPPVPPGALPGVDGHLRDVRGAAPVRGRDRGRPERGAAVPDVRHHVHRHRHHHGRLGLELEVVAARRHALGGADHQLRAARVDRAAVRRRGGGHAVAAGAHPRAGRLPPDWFVFRSPFTFAAFFIYFISALAEGNRTPFDLPEAESELVAGFNTEYSGFRWSIFSLAEWTNVYVVGAIVTTVFLGGWNVPFASADAVAASVALRALSLVVMLAKVAALTFVIIWIRWSLPRFRVDQMMSLCWKWLLPGAFAAFVAQAAWTWLVATRPLLDRGMRWAMFVVVGLGLGAFFVRLTVRAFRRVQLLHMEGRQFSLPFFERRLEKR